MFAESRKLHLNDEVLKSESDDMLSELEFVIKKFKEASVSKVSFIDFSGIWSETEASEIERIINESCETINPEDWK